LGNAYREKKEYATSIENFEKGLNLRIQKLGSRHPDVSKSYLSLSTVYYLMGNKEKGDYYKNHD
jgi:hypothetical protein